MRGQLEERLSELRAEYASGQKMLVELENKEAALKSTLVRIEGAIKVLEEQLAAENPPKEAATAKSLRK
jgi:hypothetical protein